MLNQIIGIIPQNSLEYVEFMFKSLKEENSVVHYDADNKREFNFPHKLLDIVNVEQSTGWYKGEAYVNKNSEDIAQVIYTSGTEGNPKGVLISHRALANTTKRLINVMEIDTTIKEYIGVPVHYSFGFGRCRTVSLAGGAFFIPSNGFDPLEISAMLKRDEINAISAVPSLWRVLLEVSDLFNEVAHKVKWIEIGSQYMSASEKSALKSLFSHAKIVQHYGLSEASRSTFLKIHNNQQLESVGNALYDVEVDLTQEDLIKIKGPHICSGLLVDGNIEKVIDDDGWLTTSDKGSIENDFLYYLGRSDDVINCGGIKVSPELIETQLFKLLSVDGGLAVFKADDHFSGETPKLAIGKDFNGDEKDAYQQFVKLLASKKISISKNIEIFRLETLPQTATGKIQRSKISAIYKEQIENKEILEEVNIKGSDELEDKLIAIWKHVLNVKSVSVNDTFNSLGGDSLSTIRAMIKMEAAGIKPKIAKMLVNGYSISQIIEENQKSEEHIQKSNFTEERTEASTKVFTVNIIRGLLVLANILAHWHGAVIAQLPAVFTQVNKVLSPIYSSGTPGFVIIFGIGLGAFVMPKIKGELNPFTSMLKRNFSILFIGVCLLAFLKVSLLYVENETVKPMDISNSFYSVIFYYLFAVITIPIILRYLSTTRRFLVNCIITAVIFYFTHIIIDSIQITASSNEFLQPIILLFTAKYNYFEMSSGALFGVALGYVLSNTTNISSYKKVSCITSFLLISFAVIISIEADQFQLWFTWPNKMFVWSWLFYIGVIILLFTALYEYNNQKLHISDNKIYKLFTQVLAVIGVLAFPLFIGHELVIPAKDLLSALNIPFSFGISLSCFLALSTFYCRKLYVTYYKTH